MTAIPEAVSVTLHQDRAGCEWIIVTSKDHPDSESEVTPSDDPALFDLLKALIAAQQPDHIVDATKMVAQQQGGGEVYWANGAQWPNVAPPSAPVVDDAMRKRTREWLASHNGFWDDDYVEGLLTAALSGVSAPVGAVRKVLEDMKAAAFNSRGQYAGDVLNGWTAAFEHALAQQPAAVDEDVRELLDAMDNGSDPRPAFLRLRKRFPATQPGGAE